MNPYHRYDLDPGLGIEDLTDEFRERMDRADPKEREAIRKDWEALTLDPKRRVALALEAFPQRRAVPGGLKAFRRPDLGGKPTGGKDGDGIDTPKGEPFRRACERAEARLGLVSILARERVAAETTEDSLFSDPLLVLEDAGKPRRL